MKERSGINVLTIFCLPKRSAKSQGSILGAFRRSYLLCRSAKEVAFGDRAKAHLRTLAKAQGVSVDKSLYKLIEDGKGYSAANLNLMFDEWYDRRLKTNSILLSMQIWKLPINRSL
jgi:hypothetical protein